MKVRQPCLLALALTTAFLSSINELSAQAYNADQFPESDIPTWAVRDAKGRSLDGGILVSETNATDRHFYAIGRDGQGRSLGEATSWVPASGGFVIEFSVSGSADSAENEYFRVAAGRTDLNGWTVMFYPDQIKVARVASAQAFDTRELDSYTMTVKDGLMTLSSQKKGIIFDKIAPGPLGYDALYFGSMSRDNTAPGKIRWRLDSIKWSPPA